MTMTDRTGPGIAIEAGIDRYGGDLSRWPDRDLARRAAEGALADRDLRARLDQARALDRGLAALRASLDAEIAASGSAGRVAAAVQAGVKPRPFGRLRWTAAVAVIICAAGLGSAVDFTIADSGEDALQNVVVLDPLVFGPMAGDDR